MSRKKIVTLVGIGGAMMMVAVAAWLLASGRVVVLWAGSADTISVSPRICGKDIISDYNAAINMTSVDDRTKKLKVVVDGISSKAGIDSDPNCLRILFYYYIDSAQYDTARQHLSTLEGLAAEGKFSTTELDMAQSIPAMKLLLDSTNITQEAGEG